MRSRHEATASTLLRTATTTGPPHMNSAVARNAGVPSKCAYNSARARARGRQALLRATDHVESVGLRGREDALGEPAANGVGLDEAHGLLHGVLTRAKVVAGGAGTSPSRARSCARDPADATEVRVGRLINGTLRADSQRREKRSHADFNRSDRPIMDQTRALELL